MTRCNISFFDSPITLDIDGLLIHGEPAARLYQHTDGYPDTKTGILERLNRLHRRLSPKDPWIKKQKHPHAWAKKGETLASYVRIYGQRCDDPEWAAAEYITMFRQSMCGNVYVSQTVHDDIAYHYLVDVSDPSAWRVWIVEDGAKSPVVAYVPRPRKPARATAAVAGV